MMCVYFGMTYYCNCVLIYKKDVLNEKKIFETPEILQKPTASVCLRVATVLIKLRFISTIKCILGIYK